MLVKIPCDGAKWTCEVTLANNTKWAHSMAETITQAAAHAGAGANFCFADIRWELFSVGIGVCAICGMVSL